MKAGISIQDGTLVVNFDYINGNLHDNVEIIKQTDTYLEVRGDKCLMVLLLMN